MIVDVISNIDETTIGVLKAGPKGLTGDSGDKGWSPVFQAVSDGARRVFQLDDWVGGTGTKPDVGTYIGSTGLVVDIADAVDFRGLTGPQGVSITSATVDGSYNLIVTYSNGNVVNAGYVRGATGTAATIAVGTVTTLAAGSPATVVNAGTSGAAVFNFGIPQGATGPVSSINGKVGDVYLDPTDVTIVVPTLDFDFTNSFGAPFDFLTRATNGGYRQRASGLLVPTTINEPNIDFSAGTALGTGFYGAYTQLALWSEDFSNAAWTKTNVTVTANSTVGPDGATTMDTLDATVANGSASQIAAMTPSSTAIHTHSVFLKQGTAAVTRVYLGFVTGGTSNFAIADLTWATLAVALSGTAGNQSYKLEDYGGGIYRLSVSGSNSGGANTQVQFAVVPAGSAATGTVIAGLDQIAATAFPVSYVPTTSATVVRDTDVMAISGADFTDIFNPREGTAFDEFIVPPAGIDATIWQIDAGANTDRLALRRASDGILRCFVTVASTNEAVLVLGTPTPGAVAKVAFAWAANNFLASLGGATAVTDNAGALPSVSALRIGLQPGGLQPMNSRFLRKIHWPKALTATDLQRMTA